ncbi:TIGR03619 family F420-dependent LLM class oxidoreductase [Mycobacterium sp. E1747]|uniref:TIGR03619 family F420-dependent LLM class oxidoreductase n=1 Tax=Mycobacterium sp. E1747 TaxID=1834128 RepID=UPI0007FBB921|nr:TIGR03619 family F420-dependent LLM class oxidoreductase [Mycobacterium sp. E1747]OBH08187.1 hypothetical protein A5695_26400 [Mycobacterium sp. E1747]
MKFGVAVPTCTEGINYPVPYASVEEAIGLSVTAEQLGFDSVWANEHLSTPEYIRRRFPDPPSFLDPWAYLAFIAARTSRIRLATGVTVLPFRHPVVLAKHVATLDQLSGGRLILGVGIGAYREEQECLRLDAPPPRGTYARESVEGLRALLDNRRATYAGKWVSFEDVESFPKPVQSRLPILSGGNSEGSRRRAALLGDGWMPGCLLPEEISAGLADIGEQRAAAGRNMEGFDCALQLGVYLGATREAAVEAFNGSEFYRHLRSLSSSTLAGQQDQLVERNLVGTVEDVASKIDAYRAAGVTTLAGLIFATDTISETIDMMSAFIAEMGPRYGE